MNKAFKNSKNLNQRIWDKSSNPSTWIGSVGSSANLDLKRKTTRINEEQGETLILKMEWIKMNEITWTLIVRITLMNLRNEEQWEPFTDLISSRVELRSQRKFPVLLFENEKVSSLVLLSEINEINWLNRR